MTLTQLYTPHNAHTPKWGPILGVYITVYTTDVEHQIQMTDPDPTVAAVGQIVYMVP